MKKVFRIFGISLLSLLLFSTVIVVMARFVCREQVKTLLYGEQLRERVEQLRTAGSYETDKAAYRFDYRQDSERAREIRTYFRLDTLVNPKASTWNRALALARMVARHIPHANQKIYPKRRNAIGLWEYTRTVEPAFNCRLHAILLHELLLSEGIINRFVTCLPADSTDPDCHVVNLVWLPELRKWAMLDSDMKAWATNEKGIPLSLEEMRERYINGKNIHYHPLLGGRKDFSYYRAYWAKNLYWFECWELTGYGREDNNPDLSEKQQTIVLLPQGFVGFGRHKGDIATTDAARFWAAPDEGALTTLSSGSGK